MRNLKFLLILPFTLCACGGGTGSGGEFSVNAYPALVNTTPISISGTKPASNAVRVDSVERVPADGQETFQVSVTLSEGPNSFLFESINADGNTDDSETVEISLDSIAPTVVSQIPAPNASDVPLNSVVEVTLSEPIDCATVTTSVFLIQGVSAALECNPSSPTLRLTPDADLAADTRHTVNLYSDVADPAGNQLAADVGWQFDSGSTADNTPPDPPTVEPAAPAYSVLDQISLGGWKEAGSSVIEGGQVIVPKDSNNSWNYTFTLQMGTNNFSLTSEDAAGNVSTTSTDVTIERTSGEFTVAAYPALVNSSPQTLTGTKSSGYSIWVDSQEVVPSDANSTWNHAVALSEGANTFQFEAKDQTGASVGTIQVDIGLDTQSPSIISRTPGSGATGVDLQPTVSVEFNELVDCNSVNATSFSIAGVNSNITCTAGSTTISLIPIANLSPDTPYSVTVAASVADRAGNTLGSDDSWGFTTRSMPAKLVIEFDLRDMWDYIGDEMYYRAVDRLIEINHFGVDIWVEGPYSGGESCTFNDSTKQRQDTRYVATITHGVDDNCDPQNPGPPCSGWWNLSNYRAPNYLAALIEAGQWSDPYEPELGGSWPIATDAQRRDPGTGEQWPPGVDNQSNHQPLHPELHFPWQTPWGEWLTRIRTTQQPYVDGLTEATIDSGQDPLTGPPLGQWQITKTYEWDLTDHAGLPADPGEYLINIVLNVDRARKSVGDLVHHANFLLMDRETCWDNPAHDDMGPHRAEGMIVIGGGGVTEIYLKEKSLIEYVDACQGTDGHQYSGLVRCDCTGQTLWPCPDTPIDGSKIGQRVLYMDPDKFVNPIGDGQNYAVKIKYCPPGTCP
jgi:Big-like domain-containing protein